MSKTRIALLTLSALCGITILVMSIVGIWWDSIPASLGENLSLTAIILFILGVVSGLVGGLMEEER